MAGALILTNLSASNITIGKADERKLLCAAQASRCHAAYVYSAAGPGESTTDLAWDGQGSIYELGELLAETGRFEWEPELAVADIDVQRLRLERMRNGTFNDNVRAACHPETRFRTIGFEHRPDFADIGFERALRRFPYVPNRPDQLDQDCYEAFNIQVQGLVRRFKATSGEHLVIGVSGGLDSTHALIVAAKACDLHEAAALDDPRLHHARLRHRRGDQGQCLVADERVRHRRRGDRHQARRPADARRHGPSLRQGRAGLRHHLRERAGRAFAPTICSASPTSASGFVVGTGDLSEIALGWSTYGVGDQMSHYGVNAGVPKTLIQYLIRWAIRSGQFDEATDRVLQAILDTRISPELVPADEQGGMQSTEDRIGPYELHDFFLFHILRHGQPPSKVAFMAWQAWRDAKAGLWPLDYPEALKREYDLATIRKWLEVFLFRFFQLSQYKRSAMPQRAQGLGRRRAQPARRLARAERRDGGAMAGGIEGGIRGLRAKSGPTCPC